MDIKIIRSSIFSRIQASNVTLVFLYAFHLQICFLFPNTVNITVIFVKECIHIVAGLYYCQGMYIYNNWFVIMILQTLPPSEQCGTGIGYIVYWRRQRDDPRITWKHVIFTDLLYFHFNSWHIFFIFFCFISSINVQIRKCLLVFLQNYASDDIDIIISYHIWGQLFISPCQSFYQKASL